MGKGEIAHCEQFLLSPRCFQKTWAADTYKPGVVLERVKTLMCVYQGRSRLRYVSFKVDEELDMFPLGLLNRYVFTRIDQDLDICPATGLILMHSQV